MEYVYIFGGLGVESFGTFLTIWYSILWTFGILLVIWYIHCCSFGILFVLWYTVVHLVFFFGFGILCNLATLEFSSARAAAKIH
jgi:hypothetical protein